MSLCYESAGCAFALNTAKLNEAVRTEEARLQARVGMAVFDAATGKSE